MPLIYRTRASNRKSEMERVGAFNTYGKSGKGGCVFEPTSVANMSRLIPQRQLDRPIDASGTAA